MGEKHDFANCDSESNQADDDEEGFIADLYPYRYIMPMAPVHCLA